MSRIKSKNTKPELLVRSLLHRNGFRFRLHQINLPGKPDIVLARYKTVIFINGCFWHRHVNCKYAYDPKSNTEFWNKKFIRTLERDNEKIIELKKLGWKTIVLWECDIKKDLEKVLDEIKQNLKTN